MNMGKKVEVGAGVRDAQIEGRTKQAHTNSAGDWKSRASVLCPMAV